MTLEEKLAIAKEQQHKIENGINIVQKKTKNPTSPMTGSVESLDEAVFGQVQNVDSNGVKPYDAQDEMRRIKERHEHGAKVDCSNSKIPKQIIQSIIDKPLDMPSTDPKLDAFTEKLKRTIPEGLMRSYEIQNRLEKSDDKKSFTNLTETNNGKTNIDYEMIKLIVENAIEKKIETLKNNLLNESLNTSSPSLKAMKLSNKFLFLDSDNNVFECQMKYIGKNKSKKK